MIHSTLNLYPKSSNKYRRNTAESGLKSDDRHVDLDAWVLFAMLRTVHGWRVLLG